LNFSFSRKGKKKFTFILLPLQHKLYCRHFYEEGVTRIVKRAMAKMGGEGKEKRSGGLVGCWPKLFFIFKKKKFFFFLVRQMRNI